MPERVRIETFRGGRSLRAAIEANEGALAVLTKAGRNRAIRRTFDRAATNWRNRFVWLRFTRRVSKPPFNYDGPWKHPLDGWHKGSAKLMNSALTGKIKTRKRQGSGGFVTSVPLPNKHPISKEISRVLSVVPPSEIEWMADDAATGFAQFILFERFQRERRLKKARANRRLLNAVQVRDRGSNRRRNR